HQNSLCRHLDVGHGGESSFLRIQIIYEVRSYRLQQKWLTIRQSEDSFDHAGIIIQVKTRSGFLDQFTSLIRRQKAELDRSGSNQIVRPVHEFQLRKTVASGEQHHDAFTMLYDDAHLIENFAADLIICKSIFDSLVLVEGQ